MNDNQTSVIEVSNLKRSFLEPGGETVQALDGVNVTVHRGTFVAVMGATGSGKSTLLNCAAGLEDADAGTVHLKQTNITKMNEQMLSKFRRDTLGFVFQSYNLLSELTVEQNVLLPRKLGGPAGRTLEDVLAAVNLTGYANRPVGGLSGGQRQRVAIARALISNPEIIFADEPTGALDPSTGAQILQLLRQAVDSGNHTIVMVTHDPRAAAVSDRLVFLRNGQIVADHPTPDAATIARQLAEVSQGAR